MMGDWSQLIAAVARLLDVQGKLTELPSDSDAEAIRKDWVRVGDDLRAAMCVEGWRSEGTNSVAVRNNQSA